MNVFVLNGANGLPLHPAVQMNVLAKFSRSPLTALELLAGVTPEKAEAFLEKYDVGYGHSSIAELATMPYCFENVSIIASKFLEKYQRAAYSEKSTRYQRFGHDSFVLPPGADPRLKEAANILYKTYEKLEKPVFEHIENLMAPPPGSDVKMPAISVVKARAFDNLRYLLPAGTGTNLAAVLNARDARYMMSDLLGSTLPELRELGERMVVAAHDLAPVFAMGAKANSFELPIRGRLHLQDPYPPKAPRVRLARFNSKDTTGFWRRVEQWYGLSRQEFEAHMETRGKNPVPEVFKTVPISFELVMDYGAFRDLQRHRRCEQYCELLTTDYGYVIPDDIVGTEFEEEFTNAVSYNRAAINALLDREDITRESAQYGLPLATLHRSIFQMDLKELIYIVELRTQPQGHPSYRRTVWDMVREARSVFPDLMQWCRALAPSETGQHT